MNTIESDKPIKQKFSLKKFLQITIPLAIGVVILWLLYRNTNFADMWDKIKDANFAILLFSLLFGLLGNAIRGLRWKLLIEPLGYNPKSSNLIYSVMGNYAVNFILPRAGEIWRCGIIAKEEKIPFTKLFGTMLLDRVCDTLTVATIVLLACFFNLNFFLNYLSENQALLTSIENVFTSWKLYLTIVLIVLFFYVILKVFKNTKPIVKLKEFFKNIGSDLKKIGKMKTKKRFFIYTIGIWVSYFLYFYITFFAFSFTKELGITAGLIAFAISSLSMGLPTNGGIGAWHLAVTASLVLYGVSKSSAEAFAFGVFALQSLWVILCGVYGMAALAIQNRNK